MNCLGCNLANKVEAVNVVFEDDYVCCILDHNPYNEGHVLILPKKHIRYFDELDENTANSVIKASRIISKAIKKLFNPDGITVCQNGGAFDELTHFHMHIVPRYEGQNFADFFTEDGETNIEEENNLEETKRKIINTIKVLD
ncbi:MULTISPECIES: HIT family protein [Anoxybacillus]|uniref:HIT family protein n=1 Tax=Anoxybacillus flavithermus TaxID=33934 RepID=A0AAX2A5J5_9BACL|nr:HIT family protein [Anoxybacillus flavithermus]ASA95743.1 HIT family protein [Anoxybacillus flavithermus]MBE2904644.1 HIT family protein [Anoxybacillus flavithermus]MBE2907152.1 HIT family protein [Anoxybacillus flavithermus]MBE2910277.1 HIT family protein [Anoxybacillus flavithermus]MBE2912400.1 HIT family protein [Anoxybacillus flavithermus]